MSDFLLEFGKNPLARRAVRTLGLPVPMPQALQRASGAEPALPLADAHVVVVAHGVGSSSLAEQAAGAARKAGAQVDRESATGAATASVGGSQPVAAFIVDASDVATPKDLRLLYDALHGRIGALARCGRVIVLGRPTEATREPLRSAARAGLEGFVRALGKEIGRKGATANLLLVEEGADERFGAPLRFLLSRRSAFVSGQVLRVGHLAKGAADDTIAGSLRGKTALVTGAARGIGAAIAARLAEEGARVVLVDLPSSSSELDEVATATGGVALPCDLAGERAIEQLVETLAARSLRLDIVVNNAGITRDRTLAKMAPALWDLCLAVNLEASIGLTEALLASGRLVAGGRVLCMSSIGGIAGNPGQTNYATAKRALIGYVNALAQRMARDGGAAMAVAPGFIETRMTAEMPPLLREAGRRLNSLGQGGQPQDIADAVTFLVSPGAIGLSGSTLRVCGQHLGGA